MGTSTAYGPDQIEVVSPSEEMQKISGLIEKTEGRVEELQTELTDKCRTLAESEATKILNESDRSAPVRAGLARKAVDVLQNEIREGQRVLEGLKIKLAEAVRQEKGRIYQALVDRIREDGRRLLDTLSRIDEVVKSFNGLIEEAEGLMKSTFWKTDAEKILNVAGCRLPKRCKPIPVSGDIPAHMRNFFIEKLREFCES